MRELWVLGKDPGAEGASLAPVLCRLSDSAFDSLRLWVLVALCLLRLAVTRPHLQAYLCLAKGRVEQLRREAGCIEACEIQRRVRVSGGGNLGFGAGLPVRPGVGPAGIQKVTCRCYLSTRWYGSTAT